MNIKVLVAGDTENLLPELFKKRLHLYLENFIERGNTVNLLCKEDYRRLVNEYIQEHKLTDAQIKCAYYKQSELSEWAVSELIKTTADCAIIFANTENSSCTRLIELCEWFSSKYRVVNYH